MAANLHRRLIGNIHRHVVGGIGHRYPEFLLAGLHRFTESCLKEHQYLTIGVVDEDLVGTLKIKALFAAPDFGEPSLLLDGLRDGFRHLVQFVLVEIAARIGIEIQQYGGGKQLVEPPHMAQGRNGTIIVTDDLQIGLHKDMRMRICHCGEQ